MVGQLRDCSTTGLRQGDRAWRDLHNELRWFSGRGACHQQLEQGELVEKDDSERTTSGLNHGPYQGGLGQLTP